MTKDNDVGFEAAAEIYERAEINGRLGFGRQLALVVVDFTYGFTDPDSPLGSEMTRAVTATASLITDCRAAGLPIVFSIHGYRPDWADVGVWGDKYPGLRHLTLGSRWTQLDGRLGVDETDLVIVKQYPSAFFGSILNTHLNARGVDSIIIAGATTSGCVRATAVDAIQYGFRAFVAEDCVADRAAAPHEANLFDLRTKYVDVGPSDVVRDELAARTSEAARPRPHSS
jgi:maleamate amidohydrolase